MKRKLLFLMLCIASMLGMKAQTWTAASVAENYFLLYNVGKEQYLTRGNGWDTQASMGSQGAAMAVELIAYDGKYKIRTGVNGTNRGMEHLGSGTIYTDQSLDKNSTWTFTQVGTNNGPVYNIVSADNHGGGSGTYLTANSENTIVGPGADGSTDYAKWKLILLNDPETLLSAMGNATEASPVDVSTLIGDANFASSPAIAEDFWTMEASNQNLNGGALSNPCAESWHSTFTLSQTLSVPNGVYEMRAQGFYRQDGSDDTNLPVFYINGKTATFHTMGTLPDHDGGGTNSMADASVEFSNGEYTIEPIRVFVTNNTITLGARLETNAELWCIFDNFTLSYLGEPSTTNPIDMAAYIVNPSFSETYSTGWTVDGTAPNAYNSTYGTYEAYHQVGGMHQDIGGLPNGVYKVTMQATWQDDNNPKLPESTLRLYAMSAAHTTYAMATQAPTSGHFPTEAAAMDADPAFGQIQTYVIVTNGILRIGYSESNNNTWPVIDNFTLSYYGTGASAYALLHAQELGKLNTILTGMTASPLKTSVQALYDANATPAASTDGYSTAIDNLNPLCDFGATLREASLLSANAQAIADVAYTEVTNGSHTTFTSAISTHVTSVTGAASSTAITTSNTTLSTAVGTYVSAARPTSGNSFDITCLISNPSFESAPSLTGWTNDGTAGMEIQTNKVFDGTNGEIYAQRWHVDGTIDLHQTLSSLPAGYYTLEANAQNNSGTNVKLYIGSEETSVGASNTYSVSTYLTSTGNLTFGIKGTSTSSSWIAVDNFTLTYEYYATSAEYTALNTAVNTAKTTYYNHLGFDNGEYAPYNNVAAVTAVEAAETLLSNGSKYNVTTTTASLPGLSWTANVGEVNAIYNGDFAIAAHDGAGNPQPTGWARTKGTYTGDGYNVRYRTSSESAGMAYLSTGKGLFTKMNAYYGWETGYTMPLKANTYYKITFSVGGMEDCDDLTDYVKITNPSETTTTIATFAVPNKTANTDATSTSWLDVTAYFKTDAAGDYVLGLVPRNSGGKSQNQFGYGDFNLVRATTAEMVSEYATGQMNATVKENLVNAQTAYSSSATDANYTAFVTALEAAKSSVEVYEAINTRITALQAAAQRGDIPAGSMSSMAFVTKYNDGEVNGVADATTGTYSSLDEVLTQYKSNVSSYWSKNHPDVGTDMTAFIINQGFELDGTGTDDPTGWTNTHKGNAGETHTQNSPSVTNMSGYYYNIWQNWWDAFIDLKQNITGMPIGKYTLTATLAGWETDSTPVTLSANGETEDITNAGDATGVEVSVDCFSLYGDVDIKVNGGLRGDTPGPAGTFFKADNFRLTYQGIKPLLADLINKAESRRDADGNVGDGVFQTPTLQKTNLAGAITEAQAMYENGSATFEDVLYKILDLNSSYVAFETNVNAPANGKKYYLKVTTDDHAKENNYVATKLQDDEISANNLTGYTFNASITSASPYKAQAFKFTKSEEDAALNYEYYISIERPEGEVWLTYGSLNGSAAGWATQQIQGTTDISKRGVFYIEPTSTLNKFHIRNSAYGKEIICQNAGNLYTEETPSGSDGLEFSVVEATTANVTVSCKSGKYGTVIFPFTPNIAGDSDFDNIDFYTCNRVDGETAKVSGVAKGSLQAQIPYLIYNRGGSDFTKTVSDYGIVTEEDDADGDADADTYGLLTGTYTAQAVPVSDGSTNYYVLQTKPTTGQAFYKVTSAFTSTAYKAYMTVESGGSPVKAFFLGFDELDGINNIEFEEEEKDGTVIYNLAGQRVANTQKGIYIKNGKKVVVR